MEFYAEHKTGEAEESWPTNVKELPDIEEYRDWTLSNVMKLTPVYGRRAI
jgi:hypothetical protein